MIALQCCWFLLHSEASELYVRIHPFPLEPVWPVSVPPLGPRRAWSGALRVGGQRPTACLLHARLYMHVSLAVPIRPRAASPPGVCSYILYVCSSILYVCSSILSVCVSLPALQAGSRSHLPTFHTLFCKTIH